MAVLRSGKILRESSSCGPPIPKSKRSSATKSGPTPNGSWTDVGNSKHMISRHRQAFSHLGFKWETIRLPHDRPAIKFATKALRCYNRTSSQNFKLLELGSVTPVLMPHGTLFHINFTANNTEVPHAPEEMFFTELINSSITGLKVRLCISLGPKNSVSGDRSNGCFYCRDYNNVWHPKGGGFVRGADALFKTVQDIWDINQNNAIPDHEKHLPILEQVSGSCEPKKEHEYISEQVDDATLYATEALKYYKQTTHINYELVKPGFATRVILPTCLLFHVNFKAKETDVATAPEEMFFAELTSTSGGVSCICCTILMPSELISGDETRDKTNGCYYCHKFNKVRHPSDGGYEEAGRLKIACVRNDGIDEHMVWLIGLKNYLFQASAKYAKGVHFAFCDGQKS